MKSLIIFMNFQGSAVLNWRVLREIYYSVCFVCPFFCSASDSSARGPELDTRSGNVLSFLLPLIQEGQLSVTGENMCALYL